jgi:arsenate reductase (thioredoxin)
MAEAWVRKLKGGQIQAFSAGVEIHGLNPYAVQVMAEVCVDISGYRSKHVDEVAGMDFDAVITVCDHARESCPYFPGSVKIIHMGFDDPPALAQAVAQKGGDEEDRMNCYRKVRDEIGAFVEGLPENIQRLS